MNLSDYKPAPHQLTASQIDELGRIKTALQSVKRLLQITPLVTFGGNPYLKCTPDLMQVISEHTGVRMYDVETLLIFQDCTLQCDRAKPETGTVWDKHIKGFEEAATRATEIYNQTTTTR
jgi:hypothetical protein